MPTLEDMNREDFLREDPLGQFHVFWDDINVETVGRFRELLSRQPDEREVQRFLEDVPVLLVQHLGGGHGRYVIPKQRLGAEYVPDFMIAERHSFGHEWEAVELESPQARMFTRSGDPTSALTHAIRQIQDWRAWLQRNQNYAARPITQGGLGLTDITGDVHGMILIGRRIHVSAGTQDRRRQMVSDLRIAIHTYDFLLERSEGRVATMERYRRSRNISDT